MPATNTDKVEVTDISTIAAEIITMWHEVKNFPKIGANIATALKPRFTDIEQLLALTAKKWANPAEAGEAAMRDMHACLTHFAQGLTYLAPVTDGNNHAQNGAETAGVPTT